MFAAGSPGRARRAVSQTFSPCTSALCWRHRCTSPMSRKYQPLPTMPCSCGGSAGEHRGLHAARHRGQHRAAAGLRARRRQRAQARHVREGARGQPDDVEQQVDVMRAPHGRGWSSPERSSSGPRAQRSSPAMPATRSSTAFGQHGPGVGLDVEVGLVAVRRLADGASSADMRHVGRGGERRASARGAAARGSAPARGSGRAATRAPRGGRRRRARSRRRRSSRVWCR